MDVPPLARGREPWRLPTQGVLYVLDCETDGLLEQATTLHSLVVRRVSDGALAGSLGGPSGVCHADARALLEEADGLVAHNGYRFDYPVLEKLLGWRPRADQLLLDTLPLSRLVFSDLKNLDGPLLNSGQLPSKSYGSHSMEAWGHRLGERKVGADIADWSTWTPLMQNRCESDSLVNLKLLLHLLAHPYSADAVELELGVARLCAQLELVGFPFDVALAEKVTGELCVRRAQLEAQVRAELCGWWKAAAEVVPTKPRRVFVPSAEGAEVNRGTKKAPKMIRGWHWEYRPNAPYTPVEWNVLNPGSGPQIVEYLGRLHGWKPEEFTDKGHAKVDEKVLGSLPWPEAKLLTKYLTVRKRLGQISEGNKAWLKVVNNGRIHGGINPNGAVTGRATHSEPNLAQVPKINLDREGNVLHGEAGGWGWECRSMFTAPNGMVLVGADLSKLELMCLAHYLSAYDGGAYAEVLLSGTDPHVYMGEVAGFTGKDGRSKGKTLNYAFLYGSGDAKLGSLIDPHASDLKRRQLGKQLRAKVLRNFAALGNLTEDLHPRTEQGWLYGLDGRHLPVRHKHAVLNTLLQGAGAAVAKAWLVEIRRLMALKGVRWDLLAWVHDEVQFAVYPYDAALAKFLAVEAAKLAGEKLKMRVPILADAKSGPNWARTH